MLLRLQRLFSTHIPIQYIRNFCIIAHIDHGKSTLADRLLQITNTIPKNSASQYLDKLKVERERGITVQAQTASMRYTYNNQEYLLNLVDTPGHIDFHYEVERSMRGCQGALLLVDVTQGVQAQTLANFDLAKRERLHVIPVLNKVDAICDIPTMEKDVREELGIGETEITKISAKTGLNVEAILHRIITEIPAPPVGKPTENLKLFLVNSWFVHNKNVVCLFYVMSGELKKGSTIISCSSGKTYHIFELGLLQPEMTAHNSLTPGQIGYVISNMKQVKEGRIGDTFHRIGEKVTPEPGFKPAKPMMFAGVYPLDTEDFTALEKKYVWAHAVWRNWC